MTPVLPGCSMPGTVSSSGLTVWGMIPLGSGVQDRRSNGEMGEICEKQVSKGWRRTVSRGLAKDLRTPNVTLQYSDDLERAEHDIT